MDSACPRCCLGLPLWLLCLASTFSLKTMLGLHVSLHGGNASCHEAMCMTGQAHFIMLANMVIEGFVVCRPKCTQGAEVCIYPTAHQLHLHSAQGVAGVKIPKAQHPRVPKAVGVAVGHVNAILTLAHKHDAVYGHFISVWCP